MERTLEQKAYEMFIEKLTKEELADFMLNQQKAIDRLTKNNETFRKAYRDILSGKKCT
jgi:ribonucleotide reductase beta subunit family protein with ferritin-like domain